MILRQDGGGGPPVEEGQIGEERDEPQQDVGDSGADGSHDEGHARDEDDATVGAKIRPGVRGAA